MNTDTDKVALNGVTTFLSGFRAEMRNFFHTRIQSFKHAFSGLGYVLLTQKNAWIHLAATICVVLLAVWLRLPAWQWVVLTLTIGAVWATECMNTALEALADLVSPQRHPLIKICKDAGAASVLVTAIIAVIVGLLVLAPPLWIRLQLFFTP